MSARPLRSVALALALAGLVVVTSGARAAGPAAKAEVRVAADRPDLVREWEARVEALARDGRLAVRKVRPDTLMPGRQHVRYVQMHRGVPVFGGDLAVQLDGSETVSVFGTLFEGIDVDVRPALTADQAARQVQRLTGQALGPSKQPVLGVHPRSDGAYVLAYQARVFTGSDLLQLVLDAGTGAVVESRSDLQRQAASGKGRGVLNDEKKMSVRSTSGRFLADDVQRPPSLDTYDMRGDLTRTILYLNGVIALDESDNASDTDNDWTDGAVVDAHTYAGYTYDFYFKRFGRRGLDGNDLPLISLVHPVRREDQALYPENIVDIFFVNAFYAGDGVMVYGEGLPEGQTFFGQSFNFFAGALDVVTHELTHGVTQYTSNLVYQGESGALNESFSDMMGTGAEFFFQTPGDGPLRADYLLAEDIATPGGIRSMANPRAFGDPDHYTTRFTGPEDNGGVHINSGIPNHVYFLAIEGGTNRTSGLAVQGVGGANREQIDKVMYRAFAQMMPARATFSVARQVTLQSARDLYGAGGAVERALTQAWTAVGVL